MSTFVAVNTYTHSVTYVTGNILRSLQDIVRLSGLNPAQISEEWSVLERGISTDLRAPVATTVSGGSGGNPVSDPPFSRAPAKNSPAEA